MNKFIAFSLLLFAVFECHAQATWLAGYRYRKTITFNKSMVSGPGNTLTNYIALVQVEDAELIYNAIVFEQKVLNPNAYDIAFTTTASPITPLKFQWEGYDPSTGKLLCWLQIPELYTKNATSSALKTTVYLYYGSDKLQDPMNMQVWNGVYEQFDHLDHGAGGQVGQAKSLNGSTDFLQKPSTQKVNFTISLWIKPEHMGREQVVFTNDTITSGFLLKIDSFGKLVFEILDPITGRTAYTGTKILNTGQWYAINLTVTRAGSQLPTAIISLYVNGVSEFSKSTEKALLSSSGSISIGRSKQADRYFKGLIDEWRLGDPIALTLYDTDYKIQNSPSSFSTAGLGEQTTDIFYYTFTGVFSSVWTSGVNWSPTGVPASNKSIRVKEGKTLTVPAGMSFNQLLLEKNSTADLASVATVVNRTILESGSKIIGANNQSLQLQGDLYNNGQIILDKGNSKLKLYGSRNVLMIQGSGTARIAALEIDLPALNATVDLQSTVKLTTSLRIFNGLLKAGGNLTLLDTADKTAMVYPLGREAAISGDVHVQHSVNGSFPDPSSGRGWRLLSSPVIQSSSAAEVNYDLRALQKLIFVTGAGGVANGFDASPNNGATIYTHNQELPGQLPQKYIPIPNMNTKVPVGRGFFVFSRGSRHLTNAFQQQIVTRPFMNAPPYTITYTGNLFKGPLTVQVFNKDESGEGDGFNLLGNPYAAPIRWGSLGKENVGPNVWVFDPLTNDYEVSNNPETVIPVGAGFFVRVNPGFKTGAVYFDEQAKILPQ